MTTLELAEKLSESKTVITYIDSGLADMIEEIIKKEKHFSPFMKYRGAYKLANGKIFIKKDITP